MNNMKLPTSGNKDRFKQSERIRIGTRNEYLFRRKGESYYTDTEEPFLKFTIETATHRIVFGILPAQSDTGLRAKNIVRLVPGRGTVEFNTGAKYGKPNYRTISIEELDDLRRHANLLELDVYVCGKNAAANAKRKKGTRKTEQNAAARKAATWDLFDQFIEDEPKQLKRYYVQRILDVMSKKRGKNRIRSDRTIRAYLKDHLAYIALK